MAFPPRFLDELRSRLACSEVVGRRVRLVRKGREYQGLCPFHSEKSPSFFVNDTKSFFHCFGCGAHGDVIGFTMRIDNLSFPEAVEKLAGEAGLEVPRLSREEAAREERAKTLADAVEAAAKWFEAQLRAPWGRAARDYLARRGLDDATIAKFRLGFAPDARQALRPALKAQGFTDEQLLEASLAAQPEGGEPFDFFRNRVIFPIADRRGRVIAFGGRVLDDGKPKYLNSRDTPLFDKGRSLFALDKAREALRTGAPVIVAEGYMDVIALHAAGFPGAVAPLGTALTEAQIELLWRMTPEPILCLDGDEAGRRAALRAAERALPLLKPGMSLRFALLPDGEDPDSLLRRDGAGAVGALLDGARPLADVIWDKLAGGRGFETPERRAALFRQVDETARQIADSDVQRQYAAMLRGRAWTLFRGARREAPPAAGLRGSHVPPAPSALAPLVALRTAINHPAILREADLAAALDHLPIADPALDALRHELLGITGEQPDLPAAALRTRLLEAGHGGALLAIERPDAAGHARFAADDAPDTQAAIGLRGWLDGLHRAGLREEIDAARAALAEAFSAENLARVELLAQLVGTETTDGDLIDRIEEARRSPR